MTIDINDPRCNPECLFHLFKFWSDEQNNGRTVSFNHHYIRDWYDMKEFEHDEIEQQCMKLRDTWEMLGYINRHHYLDRDNIQQSTNTWEFTKRK